MDTKYKLPTHKSVVVWPQNSNGIIYYTLAEQCQGSGRIGRVFENPGGGVKRFTTINDAQRYAHVVLGMVVKDNSLLKAVS